MKSSKPLATLVRQRREEGQYSQKAFSDLASISTKTLNEVESGAFEELLESGQATRRKKVGAASTLHRLLFAMGEDPKPWFERLDLPAPTSVAEETFLSSIQVLRSQSLTSDDVAMLQRVSEELGDLFTIDMVLRLLIRKHSEV
jgi:DNA-binding XRE family transcriptional regulator